MWTIVIAAISVSLFYGSYIVAYIWNIYHGRESLRVAFEYGAPVRFILEIIEVGGVNLVTAKSEKHSRVWNSLRLACTYNASIDVISKLVQIGGRDIVLEKDEYHGWNALHFACIKNLPIGVVSKLIEVGGRDLVMEQNVYGYNALYFALNKNVSIEVVSKILEVGGRDVVVTTNKNGWNSLHYACYNNRLHNDILDLLIQYGGREVLAQANKKGKTPLDVVITKYSGNSNSNETKRTFLVERVSFLIMKGIELQLGGEYGIGGLFNCRTNKEIKDKIYNSPSCCWDEVVIPAMERVVMTLPRSSNHHGHQQQPIVHAAIMDKAPPRIIKDIVHRFKDSINTKESSGQYPIDVAVQSKLTWGDGMKDIVEEVASIQQITALNVCAKHGVQWENGTKFVLERSGADIVGKEDSSTGLCPFMLAALGGQLCYDFDSVFHLIKSSPKLEQQFGAY